MTTGKMSMPRATLIVCAVFWSCALAANAAGWTTAAQLSTPRAAHTITLLDNGTVLVTGGTETGVANEGIVSCELFDPKNLSLKACASMSQARAHHQAIKLPGGKVLVAGGAGPGGEGAGYYLSSCELYNPDLNTWSSAGSMNTPSADHRLVLLNDGRVLRVGGSTLSGFGTTTCEIYDPAADSWALTGSLSVGRHSAGVAKLGNGQVIAAGGYMFTSAVEVFNPATETWTRVGNLAGPVAGPGAIPLNDGRALLMGGEYWAGTHTHPAAVSVYTPGTGLVTNGPPMLVGKAYFEPVLLPDGDVLVIGGASGGANYCSTNACDRFDAATQTWEPAPSLNQGRHLSAAVFTQGKVFVTGGIDVRPGITITLGSIEMLQVSQEGDADADGLPDSWENQHFGNLTQGISDDPDGDGYTNSEELASGTPPNAFNIGPASLAIGVQVGWRSVSGRTYQVQRASSPNGPWENCGPSVPGTGFHMTAIDSSPLAQKKYYRVKLGP